MHLLSKISALGLLSFATLLTAHPLRAETKVEPGKHASIPNGQQISATGITHSLLICGRKMTAIFNEESEVIWSVPKGSRDGVVLPDGNLLICESKRVVEYLKDTQKILWSYQLDRRNKEIASAWRLDNKNTVIVENGAFPRLIEVTPSLEKVVDFPLQPETENAHMQSRMARKLENGNYLVPHLLAFKVKEYTPSGEVVREISTDLEVLGGREAKNWPFTAIRLSNGHTVVNLTNGNKSAIFDATGDLRWVCSNEDVDGQFADPCGGQVLPNGHLVVGSYGQKDAKQPRVFEVTPSKDVVWEFYHPSIKAHEIHVLTTNGVSLNSYQK